MSNTAEIQISGEFKSDLKLDLESSLNTKEENNVDLESIILNVETSMPIAQLFSGIESLPRIYGHYHYLRFKDMDHCFKCKNNFSIFRPIKSCWRCGKICCAPCTSIRHPSDSNYPLHFCPLCSEIAENADISTNCPVCLKTWKDFGTVNNKSELLSEIEHLELSLKHLEKVELQLRSRMATDFSSHLFENVSVHFANKEMEKDEKGMMSPRTMNAFEGVQIHEDRSIEDSNDEDGDSDDKDSNDDKEEN
eukprot:TRINITY_DN14089_c0_g1_i1.p1 TRINITY_DN14089_c0_g1~~TRINITY_DN14089_c0_g1_i1.p1  ORF type:complete len:250 (-),score=43.39 TRINITY_DN14089_c0_g1_i1:23-772(-)